MGIPMIDLLKSLEIDTSDLGGDDDGKDGSFDIGGIKIDDVPEEQRPAMKALLDTVESQKNDIATANLATQTLQNFVTNLGKNSEENKGNENANDDDGKVLGVEKDNELFTLAQSVQSLHSKFDGIETDKKTNIEETFKSDVKSFAADHKDIVQFANEMDQLVADHPTLRGNISLLYTTAKAISEGRAKTSKSNSDKTGNSSRFETVGVSNSNVADISKVTNITEAFELAEKQKAS